MTALRVVAPAAKGTVGAPVTVSGASATSAAPALNVSGTTSSAGPVRVMRRSYSPALA